LDFGASNSNNQPGDSGSTAQVYAGLDRLGESIRKRTGVGNHVFYGLSAKGANALSRTEYADQPIVFGWTGNCH
jgi:hypothetical protein